MAGDTRARLRRLSKLSRLGLKKGAAHVPQPPPKPRPTGIPLPDTPVPLHLLEYQFDEHNPAPIEAVIPGAVVENEYGRYFSFEGRYPLSARHGARPLAELLETSLEAVAGISGDGRWRNLTWRDVLFIDTETTGLEVAAGTVAFLIGVGWLDDDDFVVRQVFMRDYHEETALLADLARLFERFEALASFNGKTFDLPLLQNRFVMARLQPGLASRSGQDLLGSPHFDLLHPARRLWRRRIGACNLSHLETEVLGVERAQADVPGYWIPTLYRTYLVTEDARPMAGIFYHNEVDVVSMASLATEICRCLAWSGAGSADLPAVDLLSLGLWYNALGRASAAERALRAALAGGLDGEAFGVAQKHLATLLKRAGRADESVALWEALTATEHRLYALEELAKYYEWRAKDLRRAEAWTQQAIARFEAGDEGRQQDEALAAWQHRLARLQRKLRRGG
ncbi:MAG: ribonuclease H-like domain-containing protein [Anaerolineae bacterium]